MSIYILIGLALLAWLFFRGGRVIEEDYEARLAPVVPTGPAQGARAKAERERFKGGDEQFDVSCSGLDLPDGTLIEVVVNGEAIGTFELSQGRGRFEIQSASGATVPVVQVSDEVELLCGGLPVLRGAFARD